MLSLFVYNKDRKKAELLNNRCTVYAERTGKKFEENKSFCDSSELCSFLQSYSEKSVFFLRNDMKLRTIAEHIRINGDSAYIVILIGAPEEMYDISAPWIRPSGILPEDPKNEHLGKIIDEIWADSQRNEEGTNEESFRFKLHGIDYQIPYCRIVYVDVQMKKITVHTETQEYTYYGTMESIIGDFPDYFMRIHRSTVVNKFFVKNVYHRDHAVELSDKTMLYYSRSFYTNIKENFKNSLKENFF